jgi:hypothetical protein
MRTLVLFYRKTKYFWIFSKFVLILLFLSAIIERINETDIGSLVVQGLFISYTIVAIVLLIHELTRRKLYKILKLVIGIINIILGLISGYMMLTAGINKNTILMNIWFLFFPFWIILLGLYDILSEKVYLNSTTANKVYKK